MQELSNLKKTLQVEVKQLRSVKYAFSWLDHFQTMKEVDLKGDEKIDMINCLNCSEIWENFQYKLDTKVIGYVFGNRNMVPIFNRFNFSY
ncbi:hypothetical protein QL285_015228 [Trifolium repens]|nr:hypothetical protein QL285_015228 [Trifolium repens]